MTTSILIIHTYDNMDTNESWSCSRSMKKAHRGHHQVENIGIEPMTRRTWSGCSPAELILHLLLYSCNQNVNKEKTGFHNLISNTTEQNTGRQKWKPVFLMHLRLLKIDICPEHNCLSDWTMDDGKIFIQSWLFQFTNHLNKRIQICPIRQKCKEVSDLLEHFFYHRRMKTSPDDANFHITVNPTNKNIFHKQCVNVFDCWLIKLYFYPGFRGFSCFQNPDWFYLTVLILYQSGKFGLSG